ncbi:MAG: HTH domain-containing protein [Fretibacterium sp.]|nr:HTH domain-containing protein [Fretibacterium sp.]
MAEAQVTTAFSLSEPSPRLLAAQPMFSARRIAEVLELSPRSVQKSIDALKRRGPAQRAGRALASEANPLNG